MNNIEILEKLKDEQYTKETVNTLYEFYDEEFKPYVLSTEERDALENLIQENKELKEKIKGLEFEIEIKKYCKVDEVINDLTYYKNLAKEYQGNCIPKSKVKELAKKYEFALNDYDSSTADYKHSQNIGKYMACIELLKEGE